MYPCVYIAVEHSRSKLTEGMSSLIFLLFVSGIAVLITDGVCFLYVLWTGVDVETRAGFTVSSLIKQRKDWPNGFNEQPCWCCVLSTDMTLLVGLSLRRTDSTFRYIVWFSDVDRKGWLRLCNCTGRSGEYYSSMDKKNQLHVTFCILYFSSNSCSTCFGQPCAHHQERTTAWCYSLVLVCAVAAGMWSRPAGR